MQCSVLYSAVNGYHHLFTISLSLFLIFISFQSSNATLNKINLVDIFKLNRCRPVIFPDNFL